MNVMNDFALLQRYARDRCESAFAELVKRYIDFVYSAAMRQVGGDTLLAQDVTQSVFVDLARFSSLRPHRMVVHQHAVRCGQNSSRRAATAHARTGVLHYARIIRPFRLGVPLGRSFSGA